MPDIVIDGTIYVPKTEATATEAKILILDRRWVIAGLVSSDGGQTLITTCKQIEYWGTTKGLGELALGGPTSKTLLRDLGTVRIPAGSEIAAIDIVDWSSWL
ncbi:hypothetical protein [Nakamurella aerolata]|uniref:Uncharacterized protein n=1 Tax=Nakamurella aerolata TaxID=1656892 RepID=A0A849A7G1_9ACTN|nr:hypothetical protein [Nakamurella aerolata]NNG36914.1 hypothetical protein [Nakamurella aerolata]